MNLVEHIRRHMAWSRATFGPHPRTEGILRHIEKEIEEVRKDAGLGYQVLPEATDILILTLDLMWRDTERHLRAQLLQMSDKDFAAFAARHIPEMIVAQLQEKQAINEHRTWPDWRSRSESEPIEHDRSKDA